MTEELIQFPPVDEMREMLDEAKEDIQAELQEDPGLVPLSKLIFEVIDILNEKVSGYRDLNALSSKEKIDIAAHISFLNSLEDDFFFADEDLEDIEIEEVELDGEPEKKKKKK